MVYVTCRSSSQSRKPGLESLPWSYCHTYNNYVKDEMLMYHGLSRQHVRLSGLLITNAELWNVRTAGQFTKCQEHTSSKGLGKSDLVPQYAWVFLNSSMPKGLLLVVYEAVLTKLRVSGSYATMSAHSSVSPRTLESGALPRSCGSQ